MEVREPRQIKVPLSRDIISFDVSSSMADSQWKASERGHEISHRRVILQSPLLWHGQDGFQFLNCTITADEPIVLG